MSLTGMSLINFWSCVALVVWTYLGFPLLLALRAKLFRKPYVADSITPRVSLIIAAHNEVASIRDKVNNVLDLDYPHEQFEFIVASDGSNDGTDEVVREFATRGVRLLSLPRQGKAATLNSAVAHCDGEILVFSDANSMFERGALRALVRPFADPHVGGVAGDQRYLPAAGKAGNDEGERRYWDFDRQLKKWQSDAGNVTSATGAIYAIRRSLFTQVPEGVTDDFAVSTAVIEQGQRLVFAADAVALEPPADAADAEFARKVRIINRGLRGVVRRRALLNPLRFGFYTLQLLSHKVLRRLMGFPLLAMLVVSPLVWHVGGFYQGVTICQLVAYACALAGWALRRTRLGRLRLFSLPFFFCLTNSAALLAVVQLVRGRQITRWQPRRQSPAAVTIGNSP